MDLSGFPADVQAAAQSEIGNRPVFELRTQPKSSREEIIAAFQSASRDRDFRPFAELSARVPDGERDVVNVMRPDDLTLIRKVRRAMAAAGNPHLMDDYPYFTGIIWTLQAKPR